jgi:hypothetical protein
MSARTFCISAVAAAILLVFVACETQPVGVDTPDAQFAKGGKPDKPGKPASSELITFTGDLVGSQEVTGCCPNRGPFPEYTMTVRGPPFPPEISVVGQTGNIFMNNWAPKGTDYGDYKVQFWWWETETTRCFIEINGGEKVYNRRTRETTVTFNPENIVDMEIWRGWDLLFPTSEPPEPVTVSFTLTRAPIR